MLVRMHNRADRCLLLGAGSHWEYVHFQGELMVSTIAFSTYNKPVQISGATLALMEDTGWYVPQYQAQGFLEWGRKKGCEFLNSSCNAYAAANPLSGEFCDGGGSSKTYTCAADQVTRGVCSMSSDFGNSCNMVYAGRAQ